MENQHAIVIDENSYKKEFVLCTIGETVIVGDNGQRSATPYAIPQYYDMEPGDALVFEDIEVANAMLKPRWADGRWEEAATEEELAELERQREAEQAAGEIGPEPRDIAVAELAEQMEANQLQTDLVLAEILEMITGG